MTLIFSSATTLNEYRAIEKDVALARRFQPIQVNEPTIQDTISILRGIKEKYEVHHGVRITDVSNSSLLIAFQILRTLELTLAVL
jgi:ATP-dependent Clp protease ATP-binding subunit ClpA